VRGDLPHLRLDLLHLAEHGRSSAGNRPAAEGADSLWQHRGIALLDRDRVEGDLKRLRGDLPEGRVMSLPVRGGPRSHDDVAIGPNHDGRALP
jgi:hypothetical protein